MFARPAVSPSQDLPADLPRSGQPVLGGHGRQQRRIDGAARRATLGAGTGHRVVAAAGLERRQRGRLRRELRGPVLHSARRLRPVGLAPVVDKERLEEVVVGEEGEAGGEGVPEDKVGHGGDAGAGVHRGEEELVEQGAPGGGDRGDEIGADDRFQVDKDEDERG